MITFPAIDMMSIDVENGEKTNKKSVNERRGGKV
jgi:hypothetical protein